jgi:hypothetical protein
MFSKGFQDILADGLKQLQSYFNSLAETQTIKYPRKFASNTSKCPSPG